MRSYAQVSPTFWTRGSGKKLRGDPVAQLLALYFFTCPAANMIGLYYLSMSTLCGETGLSQEQVIAALPKLEEIARYDTENEMVWVPESAAYQIGDSMHGNDRRRGMVKKDLDLAGQHQFVTEFLKRYGISYGLDSLISPELFSSVNINKGHTGIPDAPLCVPSSVPSSVPDPEADQTVKKIFDFWRDKMKHPTAKLDSARRSKINARLQDFTPKDLCLAIVGATKDDFLMGRDSKSNGKKYDDFKTIFRDAAQIERLIELSGQKRDTTGKAFTQDIETATRIAAENTAAFERHKQKKLEELHNKTGTAKVFDSASLKAALTEVAK